jgi:hypothetical protein
MRSSVDNSYDGLLGLGAGCLLIWRQWFAEHQARDRSMAKRKKQPSKVQKRKGATARPNAKKLSAAGRGKATKRVVARAKPKRAPVKKTARTATPRVETVAVGQSAPGAITVAEVEETEVHQAS